jgi:hypothetical protein
MEFRLILVTENELSIERRGLYLIDIYNKMAILFKTIVCEKSKYFTVVN